MESVIKNVKSDFTVKTTLLCKRIDLAYTARNRVTSEWGKNYWDGVLAYLLRAANRLN
jgi:hypothetical protein